MTERPCPACGTALRAATHDGIPVAGCPNCRGMWFGAGLLSRAGRTAGDLPPLPARSWIRVGRRHCPQCRIQLDQRPFLAGEPVIIDACAGCGGVFLDRREFPPLAALARRWKRQLEAEELAPDGAPVDPGATQLLRHYDQAVEGKLSARVWLAMFFLGIPTEFNVPPLRPPLMTWTLIAANVGAFAWMAWAIASGRGAAVEALAFDSGAPGLLTAITAAFLHAGIFHLLGNMVMLHIAGDNVEDYLGHGRFLLFYLGGAVVAAFAFDLMHLGESVRCVGASGAIAAVMAAYLVACPKARITVLLVMVPLIVPFSVFAALWVGIQTLVLAWRGETSIAISAHLGGFTYGLLVFGLYRWYLYRRTGIPRLPE